MLLKEISQKAALDDLIRDIVGDAKEWLNLDNIGSEYNDLQKMIGLVTSKINIYFDRFKLETDMNLVNEKWDTIIEEVSKKIIKQIF